MFIQTETTPNPASLKLLACQRAQLGKLRHRPQVLWLDLLHV